MTLLQKRQSCLPAVSVVVCLIALALLSCSDPECTRLEEWRDIGLQIVPIDSIAMQDIVHMSDTLAIEFWSGSLTDKPEFSHFETDTDSAHIEITAWAQVYQWIGCGPVPPVNQVILEGDTLNIPPLSQAGHCEVVVHQPDGTALVDTVAVLSNDNVVYFNSFESDADMEGWRGRGDYELVDDVPPGGGSRAIQVWGIDVIPHAYYYIGPFEEDRRYTVGFWAKANYEDWGGR